LVTATAAALHIADEVAWGLLPENTGREAVCSMMKSFSAAFGIDLSVSPDVFYTGNDSIPEGWVRFVVWCVENSS